MKSAGGRYFINAITRGLPVADARVAASYPLREERSEIESERYARDLVWKTDDNHDHGYAINDNGDRILDHVLWTFIEVEISK